MSGKKRLSNYELLRIISMMLVVYHHYALHTFWEINEDEDNSIDRAIIDFERSGGKLGVNLFILITGYFLSGRTASVSSVVKIWVQILMYSYGFLLIGSIGCFGFEVSFNDILTSIFPVTLNTYWFCTAYIGLVLLSPVLAKITNMTSHKEYLSMIIVMFAALCLKWRTFDYSYSPVFWFVFIFLVGSYHRKYEAVCARLKTLTLFFITLLLFIFNGSMVSVFSTRQYQFVKERGGASFLLMDDGSPLCFFMGITIFMLVSRFEFWSPIINWFGSATFGVYLCHEHPLFRHFLWNRIVRGPDHYQKPEFMLFSIFAPILTFIACAVVEKTRQHVLKNVETTVINYIANAILLVGEKLGPLLEAEKDFDLDVELEGLYLDCVN